MTLATAVQAAASTIGFFIVILQIYFVIRGIRGATHDRVYAHYTEVCKLFMQHPHLHPFFYSNAVPTEEQKKLHPVLQAQIELMSETILGLIEHSVVQKRNMQRGTWKQCWLPYAEERLAKSGILREFFKRNASWYTQALPRKIRKLQI